MVVLIRILVVCCVCIVVFGLVEIVVVFWVFLVRIDS